MTCKYSPGCNVNPPCPEQFGVSGTNLPDFVCDWVGRETVEEYAVNNLLVGNKDLRYPLQLPDGTLLGFVVSREVRSGERAVGTVRLMGLAESIQPGFTIPMPVPTPVGGYRFVDCLVRTDSRAKAANEDKAIASVVKSLRQWYKKHILHQVVFPGAPSGPRAFRTREEFVNVVGSIVREFRQRKRPFTQQEVARRLYKDGYYSGSEDPERRLQEHSRCFGFLTWQDVLSAVV